MRRAVLALLLAATACTGGGTQKSSPTPSPIPRGGTLVTGMYAPRTSLTFDPQKDYNLGNWETFRCCLLRTLLSYNGKPTAEGGAVLRPDLASAMPDVSDDGLTWTFHIKSGIRYAPPLQNQEIVTGDIVRALQRMASTSVNPQGSYSYSFYYSAIEGFDEARQGGSTSISGLEVPDDSTLVVHLTHPTGDLGYLFALSATAPIPADPNDQSAPFGVATGHDDDYGRFLVASGPYMYAGSDRLDFTQPASVQTPVSGFVPWEPWEAAGPFVHHGSLTLVRNPSWDPATDPLRPAYVDRIRISMGDVPGGFKFPEAAVREGSLDLMLDSNPYAPVLDGYEASPSRVGLVQKNESGEVGFLTMNLAEPPFDDVHVRIAMNLVVDKQKVGQILGSSFIPGPGVIAQHLAPDSVEGNLLSSYHPPWAGSNQAGSGDLAAARAEMRLSGYDEDGDGRCDTQVCRGVRLLAFDDQAGQDTWTRTATAIRADLRPIGIQVRVVLLPDPAIGRRVLDPTRHVPLSLQGWAPDYPAGSNIFANLLFGPNIGDTNLWDATLIGASPEQLASWGYATKSVPSADEQIVRCSALFGQAQVTCWADLDRYLMDTVVPWVPLEFATAVRITSTSIVNFSFDQFTGYPALDRIAIAPEGI